MLPNLPASELVALFGEMWLVRRWEESLIQLAAAGTSFGHYHVYIGQESIGLPALHALRSTDLVFTTHRNHGHLLGRGADPGRLLAEVLGRADGLNGGKAGTLHASAPELGIPHTSAIVGGVLPIAAGAGLAAKKRGADQVSVAFFGDGALEEGAALESFNLAALWALPVVFLCENNSPGAIGAAAGGYPGSVIAAEELSGVAGAVGVATASVDGTDAGAVNETVAMAVRRARASEGPSFVEATVQRWPGSNPLWPHLPAGETEIRFAWAPEAAPEPLVDWYREADCLMRYIRELLSAEACDKIALSAIDAEVRRRVEDAVRFATASSEPDPSRAFDGVFATAP